MTKRACNICGGYGHHRFMGKMRKCYLCNGVGYYDDVINISEPHVEELNENKHENMEQNKEQKADIEQVRLKIERIVTLRKSTYVKTEGLFEVFKDYLAESLKQKDEKIDQLEEERWSEKLLKEAAETEIKRLREEVERLNKQLNAKNIECDKLKERLSASQFAHGKCLTQLSQSFTVEEIEKAYEEWEFNDSVDIPFTEYLTNLEKLLQEQINKKP